MDRRSRCVLFVLICAMVFLAFNGTRASEGEKAHSHTDNVEKSRPRYKSGKSGSIKPQIEFTVTRFLAKPVIDSDNPDAKSNKYGFEDGMTVKIDGVYHLIVDEMAGDPFSVQMRIAHWVSPDAIHWRRVATLKETTGQPRSKTGLPYASVWGPVVVFDRQENRWNLFYTAYDSGGAVGGRIWRAVSTVVGQAGIGGPYADKDIVLQPGAGSQKWEGLQGVDSFFPYKVGRRWLALYGSSRIPKTLTWQVGLATAPDLSGPWKRVSKGNPLPIGPILLENPIVTRIDGLYVAVYDMDVIGVTGKTYKRDMHNIGFTYSRDGFHWAAGRRIAVQPDGKPHWCTCMRTPLGLVPEKKHEYTLLFTCEDRKHYFPIGMVKVRMIETP